MSVNHQYPRRFEAEKNRAVADAQNLRRKIDDIDNLDNDDPSSRSKRQRTGTRIKEQFVYQAGHKFSLIHSLWVHHDMDLFDTDLDETYNEVERFENSDMLAQG